MFLFRILVQIIIRGTSLRAGARLITSLAGFAFFRANIRREAGLLHLKIRRLAHPARKLWAMIPQPIHHQKPRSVKPTPNQNAVHTKQTELFSVMLWKLEPTKSRTVWPCGCGHVFIINLFRDINLDAIFYMFS